MSGPAEKITIGRDSSNNIVLDDPEVSRFHAELTRDASGSYLTDLSSTHGTFVDGQRISGAARLNPGQYFQFKNLNLYYDGNSVFYESGALAGSFTPAASGQEGAIPIASYLAAPFGSHGILKLGLGSLLMAIPVVDFLAGGYRYRLMQQGIRNAAEMPEWREWGALFITGLYLLLIRIAYLILPVFLFIALFLATYQRDISTFTFYFVLLLALILFSLPAFLLPMASVSFAASGKVRDAFDLPAIINRIRGEVKSYLSIILLAIAMWLLLTFVVFIPYVGLLLTMIGSFYIYCVTSMLFGEVYRRSALS